MPTQQLERELELPPYAADLDEVPPVVLLEARHFGQGDEKQSQRALREIWLGSLLAGTACLVLTLVLLGDGLLADVAQIALPPVAALLGAMAGFAHWYRGSA